MIDPFKFQSGLHPQRFKMNSIGKLLAVFSIVAAAGLASTSAAVVRSNSTYLNQREQVIASETQRIIGWDLVLNEKERAVNHILLTAKKLEILHGFQQTFPPTANFLESRAFVENSTVFDIIKRMPKGGILHIHEISIADPSWIIQNITYLPHLFYCVRYDYFSSLHFKFSSGTPQGKHPDCKTEWTSVADTRREIGDELFDKSLFHNFTMITQHPDDSYPNATMSWLRFQGALMSMTDLFYNSVTFKAFLKQSFKQMMDDNTQYIEIRTLLFPVVDLEGNPCTREATLQQYIDAIEEFRREHPKDFIGAKIISSSIRHPVNRTFIKQEVELAMELRQKYPQFFAGYDLVAQEDLGGPLIDYINELLFPSEIGVDLPFFFHAGETNWEGMDVDMNLIDAVLLNTSRIGHGYAINKHPVVMEMIKEKGIAIEINPISNQVLHLVHDLRNHIGAGLIADDYPVVVSSDDPAAWGALPLSHDYYMAFMGMSGEGVGLTLLKQLVLNSFKYSAMTESEKTAAVSLWQAKWDTFLDEVLANYGRDAPADQTILTSKSQKFTKEEL